MFQFPLHVMGLRRVRQTVTFGLSITPLFAGLALAQQTHDMTAMPPATPVMAGAVTYAAPLQFDSVLSRYKPMTDQKLGSWRDANDTVTRIGGWRTYLKESQQPDAVAPVPALTAPATSATPKPPAPVNPHAGHEAKP